MSSGIVLLDEHQQRSLYASSPPEASAAARRPMRQSHRSSLPRSTLSSEQSVTNNQGLPRTNYLTSKPSYNSSARTDFTRSDTLHSTPDDQLRGLPGVDDTSYPILKDDRPSTGDFSDQEATHAHRYAGTSSGLKISVNYILAGVVVGVALGVALSLLRVSSDVAKWVTLPGDLFLRALKCIVVPYAFCAVAVAIGDIVFVGKVSVVGAQTFRMFALFWVSSTAIGMAIALAFRPLFRIAKPSTDTPLNSVGFLCPDGDMLAMDSITSRVSCTAPSNSTLSVLASFVVSDVNNVFSKNSQSRLTQLSLTDQLIAIIKPVVSSNITSSMAKGDLLSIITFAMVLGAIAGRNYFTKTRRVNYLYLLLLQLRNTFFLTMEWIIWLSPVAVISIIAGSFASNQDSLRQFGNLYVYVLAALLAAFTQMMVVFPLLVFLLTRCNPYHHMRQMVRAYMFAFACSSSLATAPVTLTCVKKAKVCSQSLGNFVISIGVCSNLSAVGWYVPIAIIFIAESSGNGDQITLLRLVGIFVLSVLQCAGTPPIPSGVLVSIATIYTALFGVSDVPDTFAYVFAMDFLVDRLVTVCDVNDDIMCLKVIAENTDETVTQEQLGERD